MTPCLGVSSDSQLCEGKDDILKLLQFAARAAVTPVSELAVTVNSLRDRSKLKNIAAFYIIKPKGGTFCEKMCENWEKHRISEARTDKTNS